MTENSRSDAPTSATEESQSPAAPFEVTREMTSLDEVVLLLISSPDLFSTKIDGLADPLLADIVDPSIRLNADNFPAAAIFVLFGKPSFTDIAITPKLVASALLRLGVSRFEIYGSVFTALGSNDKFDELLTLAQARKLQVHDEPTVVTMEEVKQRLIALAATVVTQEELRHMITGIAITGVALSLAQAVPDLLVNFSNAAAKDIRPDIDSAGELPYNI